MPQTKSKRKTSSRSQSSYPGSRTNSTSRATSRSGSGASQSSSGNTMLEKFFYDSLKDIYWAEKHLTKALPKLSKAATSEELVNALDEHLEVTEGHIERLEQVFELLGKKAQGKKCEAMEGLTKEAESVVEETEDGSSTRDVGIIISAQKVEHYEIAAYGGLAQLAKTMGLTEIHDLLGQTLDEEKQADESLTGIAENTINLQAEEEGEEEEE
ncbi:MAG: ferritin-like domain-containing protein [Chitinophagaceae bacterium]|nr:ferritin-like domain-containing protein [Chitinophagaceae bacterium]